MPEEENYDMLKENFPCKLKIRDQETYQKGKLTTFTNKYIYLSFHSSVSHSLDVSIIFNEPSKKELAKSKKKAKKKKMEMLE